MFRRYKTLILFLVLATMSLRGMAAVDMWHCAHHQNDAIFSAAAGHHGMHGDTGAHHADHSADHAGGDSSAPGNSPDDSASPKDHKDESGAHCISGAVAPVELISFSFAPVGAIRIPFIELRFVGVVPAQLDRPPLVQSL